MNLPIVSKGATMKEPILANERGALETVLLSDTDNKLIALLSDGDVRRALIEEDFDINTKRFYTQLPTLSVSTDPNILASDALVLIEEKKIQLLVITDTEKHIQGVLHLHTLIEEGIS